MRERYLIIALIVLFLSGCIPKTHTLSIYSLNEHSSVKVNKVLNKTVKINYPNAINGLGGSRIYYNDNSKTGYYLYSRWSSSLNRIIYSNILLNMQESSRYRYVVGYGSSAKANRVLEIEILKFNHIINNEGSYAKSSFNVRVIDSKSGRVLKSKIFRYTAALQEKNAAAFVRGAKENLKHFLNDLILFN
jgi:ABC-type uncharacterized transport system auxiliary subunit